MDINFSPITGIFKALLGPVTTVVTGWQARKSAKLDSDLRVNEAVTNGKVKRLNDGQAADIAWDNTSIKNAGWKDEWFTVVLSVPAILVFIPGMAPYIAAGFVALGQTPLWYQTAFGIAVASSFGYKKFADFMMLRRGV